MKRCINCKTVLEDDELFCHECGTKQEIEESVASTEEAATLEKKCIHCGETIEEDSAFCPYCGKPQTVEDVEESLPDEQTEELEPKKESVPEEKVEPEKDETISDEKPEPKETVAQEIPEEQISYEVEEEKKSKKWLWVLLVILLVGAGAWYFFSQNGYSLDGGETVAEAVDSTPITDEPEGYDDVSTSPLAFLEQFYKGDYKKEEYIKQHVTANVINKLKRDYEYECPSGNCLATWVFTAYPPGSDLYLEEGPIITESKEVGKYSVYYSYYTQGQSGRIYKPRGLLVSVTQIDGKYLISDYELVMPDVENDSKSEFISEMYSDFFVNKDFSTEDVGNLRKYLSENVIEKILIECPYDGSEGEKSYVVECFVDGSLTYERPDYGDRVVKRDIKKVDDEWYEVTNIWDVIDEPVKISLKVSDFGDNNYKVTDFKMPMH